MKENGGRRMEECGRENRVERGGDLYGATHRHVKAIDAACFVGGEKRVIRYFGKLAAKGGALQQEFCVKHG